MSTQFVDDSIVRVKGLTGTGRWVGLNDRYRFGPEQLSADAQTVLTIALTYRSGRVPTARGLYEAQRDQAKALAQRYMGEKRVKAALAELKVRGFYGIRRISAGRDMIVTIRTYSNVPFEHLAELGAVPREKFLKKYFPSRVVTRIPKIKQQEGGDEQREHTGETRNDDGDRAGSRAGSSPVGQQRPVESGPENRDDPEDLPAVRRPARRGPGAQPVLGRRVLPRERVDERMRTHRHVRRRHPGSRDPGSADGGAGLAGLDPPGAH